MLQPVPDRTIPFSNLILRCDRFSDSAPDLPEGYAFRMYRDGDERAWARLECEIGDFDAEDEAVEYFRTQYLHGALDVGSRCAFAVDPMGEIIGSCIAWKDLRGECEVASLHWLVVAPRAQGLGIGKALCRKVMQIFRKYGETPVYIHTQPWSCKAILLYVREGFTIQKTDSFSRYENQYALSMATLKNVLPDALYRELEAHSSHS